MKEKYEALRRARAEVDARKEAARRALVEAQAAEVEAVESLAAALSGGKDAAPYRKARSKAREAAEEAREAVDLIEAGRGAVLAPYGEAILAEAPVLIAKVQAGYDAAVDQARALYGKYREALAAIRGIEQGAEWIHSAVAEAREVTGSDLFYGLNIVNVERSIEGIN